MVHLTTDWVRRSYGQTGTIDPSAGLKTLTVNGGGLFALNQTHADTSHLLLSFDTDRIDCDTYLDTGARQPWWLTRELRLRAGDEATLVEADAEFPDGGSGPLPEGHPLLGEIRLQIEGLPQDREWEPWVTLARGTVRRVDGHRPRLTTEAVLETREGAFVISNLSQGAELAMTNLLPRLELLGSENG